MVSKSRSLNLYPRVERRVEFGQSARCWLGTRKSSLSFPENYADSDKLAKGFYANFSRWIFRSLFKTCRVVIPVALLLFSAESMLAQGPDTPDAPVVTKVEPPNWWVNLTPDLMLLLAGKHLQATNVSCNLPEVIVSRSESTASGNYLFVWLNSLPHSRVARPFAGSRRFKDKLHLNCHWARASKFSDAIWDCPQMM